MIPSRSYAALFLAFVTLGVYYPVLFAPLNSIDDLRLYNVLLNQEGISFLSYMFPGGESSNYYRPLLMFSYFADKYFWGLEESFMHLENVVLHVMNVLLVFCVAMKTATLLRLESRFVPFAAALLFALHPINSEAVAWISGRSDVLCGFFVLASLWFLLQFMETRRFACVAVGGISLLLGCLSKETALFFIPGVPFLLFARGLEDPAGDTGWLKIKLQALGVYVLAVAGALGLRFFAFDSDRGFMHVTKAVEEGSTTVAPSLLDQVPQALMLITKVCGFYLKKLFFPLPLNFGIVQVDAVYVLPGIALFILLFLLLRNRGLVAGLLLSGSFIASSALIAVFTGATWTPFAERYMYIPSAFFVISLSFAVARMASRQTWAVPLLSVLVPILLAASAFATVKRAFVWQDNLTLFEDTVRKSPTFAPARNELAIALESHGRRDEAEAIIRSVVQDDAQSSSLNRALLLAAEGNFADARQLLLQRLENPGVMEVAILEALIDVNQMRVEATASEQEKNSFNREILAWLERLYIIERSPFHYYRMGRIYLSLADHVSAQRCFAKAAEEFPPGSMYKVPSQKLAEDLKAL